MLKVQNSFVTTFAGDSNVIAVPLYKEGVGVQDWSNYNLFFQALTNKAHTDAQAVIQKYSGVGLTVVGQFALLDIVPQDTVNLENVLLYCGIRAQHNTTGAKHTFDNFLWQNDQPNPRNDVTSIPIYTTQPPIAGGGGGSSTYAALTDKATADLPTINTPLANALSGKIATGGNAGTVTNIGDLTGVVTSTNRETAIADGAITNAMLTAPLSAFSSGLAYNGITVTLTPPGGDLAITGGIYATGGIQAIGNISTAQITVTGGGSVAENFSVGGILSATSFVGPLTGQADVATSAIAGAEGFTLSIGGAPDVVVGNTNNRFFDAYGSAISASYAISANYANYADNAGIANTAYAADAANSAGIAYYANYADSSSDFNTFFYGMYPNTSFGADGAASFAGGKIAFTADGQAGFRDGSTFGKGVQGYSENGRGVQGQSSTQIGIYGESATGTGVFAISYSGFGFRCRSNFGVPMRLENASGPVLIVANNGRLTTGYTIQLKGYTVATLPSGLAGDTAYVTDALTPAFMAVLVGGGAVVTKAFFNGSNWTAQ